MENNRFQHSMAVTIPHPPKNQFQQMQSYHNQAAQSQQSQPKLILSQQYQQQSNSRISSSVTSVSTNFNQISKTATSLLNEIYEKHLLNQTTFENVNAAASVNINRGITTGAAQQPDADHNFNNLCHQVSSTTPVHQQYHNPRPQQNCNVELNVHRNALNYAMGNMSENVGSNSGGGDLMVQRNVKTRMPKRTNENLPMKMQKNAKYLCDSKQSIASGRKYPLDVNEPSLYEISYVQRSKTDVNLFYGGSDLGAMQSKQFTSDINSKISVRTERTEPVGGNFYQENVYSGCNSIGNIGSVGMSGMGNGVVSGAVNNKYENRNSKINIMLETAQAMAAAAYFARFVEIYYNFSSLFFHFTWT